MAAQFVNCTFLDETIAGGWDIQRADWLVVTLVVANVLLAVALLTVGAKFVRTLASLAGGGGGAFVVYTLARPLDCETRLVVTAGSAVGVALVALCLVGPLGMGGAGFGVAALVSYDPLPLASLSSYYRYVVVAVSAVGGGILSYLRRKLVLRIASAIAGAGCVLVVVELTTAQGDVPPGVGLATLVVLTGIGVKLQTPRPGV